MSEMSDYKNIGIFVEDVEEAVPPAYYHWAGKSTKITPYYYSNDFVKQYHSENRKYKMFSSDDSAYSKCGAVFYATRNIISDDATTEKSIAYRWEDSGWHLWLDETHKEGERQMFAKLDGNNSKFEPIVVSYNDLLPMAYTDLQLALKRTSSGTFILGITYQQKGREAYSEGNDVFWVPTKGKDINLYHEVLAAWEINHGVFYNKVTGNEDYVFIGTRTEVETHYDTVQSTYDCVYYTDYAPNGISNIFPIGETVDESKTVYSYPIRLRNELLDFNIDINHRGMVKDFILSISKDNNKIKNDPSSIGNDNNNRLFFSEDYTNEYGATWASNITSYETGLRRSIDIDSEGNKTFGNPYDYCDIRKIPMQTFKDLSYVDFSIYLDDGSLYYKKYLNETELSQLDEVAISDVFFEFDNKYYYVLKSQTKTGARYDSGKVTIREPKHLDFSFNGGFEVDTGSTEIYDRGIRSVYAISEEDLDIQWRHQSSVAWVVNNVKLANPVIDIKNCYFRLDISWVMTDEYPQPDNNAIWGQATSLGTSRMSYNQIGKPCSVNIADIQELPEEGQQTYIAFTVKVFEEKKNNGIPEIINEISYNISPIISSDKEYTEFTINISNPSFPAGFTLQSIALVKENGDIFDFIIGGEAPNQSAPEDKNTYLIWLRSEGHHNNTVMSTTIINNYHCNDMTWNSDMQTLFAVDMSDYGKISTFDLDFGNHTITQKDNITIPEAVKDKVVFSIVSYDNTKNMYYAGQPRNKIYILDPEFKYVNSISTTTECKDILVPGDSTETTNSFTATQGSFCKDGELYICSSIFLFDFKYDENGKVIYDNENLAFNQSAIRRITQYNLSTGSYVNYHDYFSYGSTDELETGYVDKNNRAYIMGYTSTDTGSGVYTYKAYATQLTDSNGIYVIDTEMVNTKTIKDTMADYETNHMTNISESYPISFTDNNNVYTFEFGSDGTSEYNSQYIDFVADIYPLSENSFDVLSPTKIEVTVNDAKCQDNSFPDLQFYMVGIWDGARGISDKSRGFIKNENNMYSNVINPTTWDENVLVNGEFNSSHFEEINQTITYNINEADKKTRLSHTEHNNIVFDGNKFIFRFKNISDNIQRGKHGDIKYLNITVKFMSDNDNTALRMIRKPYDLVCRCYKDDPIHCLTQDYNYSFELDGETYYFSPSYTSVIDSPILLSPTGYGMKYMNNSNNVIWEYGSVSTEEPIGVYIEPLPTYTCPWELRTFTHGGSVDFIDKSVDLTDKTTLFKYGNNVNLLIGDEYDIDADEWSDCLSDSIYDLIIDNQMEEGRRYNWITENIYPSDLLDVRAADYQGNINSIQYMLRRYTQRLDKSYSKLGLTIGVGNMDEENKIISDNFVLSGNDYKYCIYTANISKPQIWRPSYSVIPEFTSEGGFTAVDKIILTPSTVGCIRHKDIHIEFDSVVVEDLNGNQFVSIISPNTTVQKNKQSSVINTIGGRTPYIVSNSENDYYTGTTSGVFAIYDCDSCDFEFKRSRLYRNMLNDILTSEEPKILRTLDGYGFIIGVSTPSEQYNGHRYLVITSFDWTQIGDLNSMADISEFNIINNPLFVKDYQYKLD